MITIGIVTMVLSIWIPAILTHECGADSWIVGPAVYSGFAFGFGGFFITIFGLTMSIGGE